MSRAQCIVHRQDQVLMAKHRMEGQEWWCLPGGAVEEGEMPRDAALRELQEETGLRGTVVRQTAVTGSLQQDVTYTYLVDVGNQQPRTGRDPEFSQREQILVEIRWMPLDTIPERDRAFLWAAGLLGVPEFLEEVSAWGEAISYPGRGPE